jgi:hypothetical protein
MKRKYFKLEEVNLPFDELTLDDDELLIVKGGAGAGIASGNGCNCGCSCGGSGNGCNCGCSCSPTPY